MELVDTNEVAALLGVKAGTVRTMAYRGLLTKRGHAKRASAHGRPRSLFALEEVELLAQTRRAA